MVGDSIADAELFLQKWRRSRYLLLREGIAPAMNSVDLANYLRSYGAPEEVVLTTTQHLVATEMQQKNEFLEYRLSKTIRNWIKDRSQHQPAATLEDCVAAVEGWIAAREEVRSAPSSSASKGVNALHSRDGLGPDADGPAAECSGNVAAFSAPGTVRQMAPRLVSGP